MGKLVGTLSTRIGVEQILDAFPLKDNVKMTVGCQRASSLGQHWLNIHFSFKTILSQTAFTTSPNPFFNVPKLCKCHTSLVA